MIEEMASRLLLYTHSTPPRALRCASAGVLLFSLVLATPAASATPDPCAQAHQIRADLEVWKSELAKKGVTAARVGELFTQLHLKTGFARELPDVEQAGTSSRSIQIQAIDELKAKLTGRSRPEHLVVVKYLLRVGKTCGDHEDHCFEGYAIQVLRPLGGNQWCSLGADLSAEIWGPDRDFTFCTEARGPTRDFAFFALTRNGRKVIQIDDYRAHCPSTGTKSSHHERSYWEVQEGSLAEIFKAMLHSQSGGPDFGKKTTLKGKLIFSGDFPKRIHFEGQEEECGPDAFLEDSRKAKKACKKSDRFQVYQYTDGHYSPEPTPAR